MHSLGYYNNIARTGGKDQKTYQICIVCGKDSESLPEVCAPIKRCKKCNGTGIYSVETGNYSHPIASIVCPCLTGGWKRLKGREG